MFDLNEALAALKGHDEFAVKVYDGLVCLDYIVCFPASFSHTENDVRSLASAAFDAGQGADDLDRWLTAEKTAKRHAWIRRNCRGVTFSQKTGKIVSLPLHKFFNVNQTAETQFDLLKDQTATIYEKLDGSMIHFFMHPDRNELQAATCRSTQTPQAQEALKLAKANPAVEKKIIEAIEAGWTPVFEFVAAHNQIVVHYPRPRLVYLISRNRNTGEYSFDDSFPDKAVSFKFPFSKVMENLDRTDFEGYVCHLPDGIVKAKTPWYFERHRAVDAFMRPAYKMYGVVFQGIMDDLIGVAPDRYKPILVAIYEEAQRDLLNEKLRLEKLFFETLEPFVGKVRLNDVTYRVGEKLVRKHYVEAIKEVHKGDFGLLMALYSGHSPDEKIKERLMAGYQQKYPNRLLVDLEEESGLCPHTLSAVVNSKPQLVVQPQSKLLRMPSSS